MRVACKLVSRSGPAVKHVHGIRELRVVKATSADDAKAAELGRRFEGCRGRLHRAVVGNPQVGQACLF